MGQQQALAAVSEHARRGFRWVVDADIEQFFDKLDHQQLMTALRRRISDGVLLRLIYRWLKAGSLWAGEYHDTDQGSPQGGVLSPLLANVYLHTFDQAQQQQKAYVGRLVRYADDFLIQCGTAAHAERAYHWASAQLAQLGLRLHPQKTRVVVDTEGFDFLGFHHRRVKRRENRRESSGVLRWPSRKAQQRFRAQVRQRVGPPQRLRREWGKCVRGLRQYLQGYCPYFRHGQSTEVFAKLDYYVECRVSRNFARSQPQGTGRRRRSWEYYLGQVRQRRLLPRLTELQHGSFRAERGKAKVRWRAV